MYKGRIKLLDYKIKHDFPSSFVFQIENYNQIKYDIEEHADEYSSLSETEREAVIRSRIGQGIFRKRLFDLWEGCSVTGINTPAILKASHIKPWRHCTNFERTDPYNGLLFTPNLDALFDCGYISFGDKGNILISKLLIDETQRALGINDSLIMRFVHKQHCKYLRYHRNNIYLA